MSFSKQYQAAEKNWADAWAAKQAAKQRYSQDPTHDNERAYAKAWATEVRLASIAEQAAKESDTVCSECHVLKSDHLPSCSEYPVEYDPSRTEGSHFIAGIMDGTPHSTLRKG